MLPIMWTREDTVPAPASGVNKLALGGAADIGLSWRRLRKLGTSDAELRGMGPGDKVGARDARCDNDVRSILGGSENTASAGGAAPVISHAPHTTAAHRYHTGP